MIFDAPSLIMGTEINPVLPISEFSEEVLNCFNTGVNGYKILNLIPYGILGNCVIVGKYVIRQSVWPEITPEEKVRKFLSDKIDFSSITKQISRSL